MRKGLSRFQPYWPQFSILALGLLYLATVIPGLGDSPLAGGDEGWIISAAHRLAEDGVFGSKLFQGFYGVENYYFFNLPLHHLMLAGVFKIFGTGLLEARLLSALFGLATLLLTYAVGVRLLGHTAGVGAAALLLLLRLNLAPFSGLTLTDLGSTVRYDLVSVPFALAAVYLLARQLAEPKLASVFVAGLLVGLAGLTQFLGMFLAPPLLIFLLSLNLPVARRLLLALVFGLAVLLPMAPYTAFALSHWDDFRGQSRAFDQDTDFLSPAFYVEQLANESERYAISTGLDGGADSASALLSRPSARLVMLLAGPAALIYALWRAGRGSLQHRLLAITIISLLLELTFFESTKRFVYWVVLTPFVSLALADLGLWLWQQRPTGAIWLPRLAVVLLATVFVVEGLAAMTADARDATRTASYTGYTSRLDSALPSGARVLGDNRLWPGLRQREYRSLLLVFYHTNPEISRDRVTDVYGAMDRIGADYLLLSPLSREILARLSPQDSAEFQRYLSERAELVSTISDKTYGPTDVYRLSQPDPP